MIDIPFSHKILNENTIVIEPGQGLDNNNAHEMVEAISGAQSAGYKYIILNMELLEFISSAGVGSILGTIETSRDIGGDIVICNASDTILQVFKVLDLTDYLSIKHDEPEAIALCGAK